MTEDKAREELEEAVRELMAVESDDTIAYERGNRKDLTRRTKAWAVLLRAADEAEAMARVANAMEVSS